VLLRIDNMSLLNSKKEAVLDAVSLSVGAGDFVGIVGYVGSGKTALLEVMAEMTKPHTGSVIYKPGLKKCFLFQNSEEIFSQETVYNELALGPRHMGWSEDIIRAKSLDVLDSVYIGRDFLERSPFSLSDGEKRRLALALFLIMEPDILFLDEPLRGLDPRNKIMILKLLKSLQKKYTLSIVMASSSVKNMFFYTEKLLFLEEGRISFYGAIEDFARERELSKLFESDLPLAVTMYNRLLNMGVINEEIPLTEEKEFLCAVMKAIGAK